MKEEKIYTSKELLREANEQRRKEGLNQLPEINPCRGGTSTLARKDKSWNNIVDFLVKLFKSK